ncbi:hypothetical protein [Micromonospora sp. WMMD812]|uniref:hypothetical protein n=1 Tax=Micromonospora sp. WMMD812 TaxID=3015152 RepID=UPI00248B339A|nr:hypothetical protein [Micromonospora sp. WMMD812]WBB68147.1 hypothetical protein O7603_01850 [Micromonospora sp. WMMD812]
MRTAFQSVTSVVILYIVSSHRGWMCRSCGLAMFRHHTNRSLLGGWWGIGVIAIPIFLLFDRVRLRRVLRLDPPRPTPGVAAHSPVPLDPGKPVLARPGGILAIVLLTLLVVVVGCGIVAVTTSS